MTLDPFEIPSPEGFAQEYKPPLPVPHDPSSPRFRERLEREKIPDHQWYRIDRKILEKALSTLGDNVIREIRKTFGQDIDLDFYAKLIVEIQKIPYGKPKLLVITGTQGYGKTTVHNAIQCDIHLGKTSCGGRACTQYPTKFILRNTPDRQKKDISIKFMDKASLTQRFQGLIDDFVDSQDLSGHGTSNHDPGDENWGLRESTVWSIMRIVCNAEDDIDGEWNNARLEDLLTPNMIANGALLDHLVTEALARIDEFGADDEGLYTHQGVLDKNIAEIRDRADALYPIVELMTMEIYTFLASNFVEVVDLSGSGDIDHVRLAQNSTWLKQADHVFVVGEPSRLESDHLTLAAAQDACLWHGAENVTLVVNKNDNVLNDKNFWGTIRNMSQQPFPALLKAKEKAVDEKNSLMKLRRELGESGKQRSDHSSHANIEDRLEICEAYNRHLTLLTQTAFLQHRERVSQNEVKRILGVNINIYHVSAGNYIARLEPLADLDDDQHDDVTRIPDLRCSALGLRSMQNYKEAEDHVFKTVPETAIDGLENVLTEHNGSEDYSQFCTTFEGIHPRLQKVVQADTRSFFPIVVARIWIDPGHAANILKAIAKDCCIFGKLPWRTFDKILRQKGIPTNSTSRQLRETCKERYGGHTNLNWVIMNSMRSEVDTWRAKLDATAIELQVKLLESIRSLINPIAQDLHLELKDHFVLRRRVTHEWEKTHRKIVELTEGMAARISRTIRNVYIFATAETDKQSTVAKLCMSLYELAAGVEHGDGRNERQRDAMVNGLTKPDQDGKTILDRYENVVLAFAKSELEATFSGFQDDLKKLFFEFFNVMRNMLTASKDRRATDTELRKRMKELIPDIKRQVNECKAAFANAMPQNERSQSDGEDDDDSPNAKKRKVVVLHVQNLPSH